MRNRLAVAALVAAVLASSAFAAHATTRLDMLAADVANRAVEGLASAQVKALAKATKTLAKKSTTESADMALAAGAAKILDASFAGDATFGADLDAALTAMRADATADRASLADYLAGIPDGKKRTAA